MVLLIVAAHAGPRALAFRGVSHTASLDFVDSVTHLKNAHKLHYMLAHGERSVEDTELHMPARWPRGVYHASRPWMGLFGPMSLWTTQLTNLIFWLVMVVGLTGLGATLFSARVGLWAALLATLCPGLVASSWYYSLDYPLAAMTTVGLWLLCSCRGFSRWGAGLAFGAWSALGLFVKLSYVIYLLPAAMAVVAWGLWRSPNRVMTLARATASVTLTLGLSLLLVDPGLGTWNELMSHQQTASGGDVVYFHDQLPPGSLLWFVSYPVFAAMSYPLPLLVTALPGLARILGRRHRGRALPVWIFIWCSLLILTFMAVRMGRYVLPLFPALCLLSAWWGSELQPHRWRRPVLAALAALFLMVLVWEHGAIPGQGGWIGDGVQRNFAVMNDTTMPTEEDMARLREGLIPNLHCELDLFLREISEISLQEGGTNPLAMGGRGLGKLRLALPEAVFMGYIVLQAKQRITNRFVYELDPDSGKRQILGPMTFLLMHPAGLDLRQEGITGKVLISRYQPIHCQARTTPFRLSLIKTTTALSAGKR